jgi:carboxyl-terminal processing protease
MNQRRSNTSQRLFLTLLVVCGFFGSFLGGYLTGTAHSPSLLRSLLGSNNTSTQDADFTILDDVWGVLQKRYVNQPIDAKNAVYGAISGLLASLEDPYTVFFTPEESRAFQDEIQGTFEGIGAEIGMKETQLVIIAPLPESPASKAGLFAGDAILSIDGIETTMLTLDAAVEKIRGPKGSTVTLVIQRSDEKETRTFAVTREKITVESVRVAQRDSTAEITLSYFGPNTAKDFQNVVNEILLRGDRGVLLDLRSNPGGYLDAAVDIASHFLKNADVVVLEETSDGKRTTTTANADGALAGIPLVVLIDGGSASGSEIVAGALHDHGVATLIGEKTFGKGTVQEVEDFQDGSSLKITIARWLTPKGVSIQDNGIEPDEVVRRSQESGDDDPQLQRARDVLETLRREEVRK